MPFPILLTKLYPPLPAEGFVHRHSLMDRVQAGINGRLTIISAPPGFGKTTLLSAWISNKQNKKVAWYSLDEDDNELGRFFTYIVAAFKPIESRSSRQRHQRRTATTGG
jgi:LuxR family maltose regulon positive regulatory protein